MHYQVYGFYWTTDYKDEVLKPAKGSKYAGGFTDLKKPKDKTCTEAELKTKKCTPKVYKRIHYLGRRIKILDSASFMKGSLVVLMIAAVIHLF